MSMEPTDAQRPRRHGTADRRSRRGAERFDGTARHAGLSFSLPDGWQRRGCQRSGAGNIRPRLQGARQFPDAQKFSTWLYTIAANLARNHFRWRSRHPTVSLETENAETEQTLGSTLPSDSPAPNEQAPATERAAAVRAAVRKLPEDLREAIVLCEWEELSVAEAAKILETTPKAVESRLYRARGILRERLKNWL